MSDLLARAHLGLALLTLIGPVVAWVLLRRPLDLATASRLRRVDALNAGAATLVLLVGLLRMFHFGKGPDHYLHLVPFLVKLVLYAVASGLSFVCTRELRSWAAPLRQGRVPALRANQRDRMRRALVGQTLCVLGMVLCAALAARGWGPIRG